MRAEGSIEKWQSSGYYASAKLPKDDQTAYMGELTIARDSGTLRADGGPCPIIAVYRLDSKLGALLHVDGGDAEINGNNHEELIDQLLELEPGIAEGAVCHVFYDAVPAPGLQDDEEEAEQSETRTAFAERIRVYLTEQGFPEPQMVLNGLGKSVHLDTGQRRIEVMDEDEEVSFAHDYGAVPEQEVAVAGDVEQANETGQKNAAGESDGNGPAGGG